MVAGRLRSRVRREAIFARSAVRHPRMLARRVRRAGSPTVAFVERNHDPARTLLLVGSRRSGTTWLAEVLVAALEARFVYEPLRTRSVPWTRPVRPGLYVPSDHPADDAVAGVIDRVVTGRFRNRFTDKYNAVRFPRCRVVKEVRLTNLLPWIARRYPATPIVYLLRHPLASAWSVTRLGWPDNVEQLLDQVPLRDGPLASFRALITEAAASPDPLLRVVLAWCLENLVPLRCLPGGRVHVVFYENLVTDPRAELQRLGAYLDRLAPRRWRLQPVAGASFGRPSHSSRRRAGGGPPPRQLDAWMGQIPAERVERALSVVRGFGLDRIYGPGALPLVPPDDVLPGVALARPTA